MPFIRYFCPGSRCKKVKSASVSSIFIAQEISAAPPESEKILFLHYPPIFGQQVIPEFFDAMKEYGVKQCFYGHLHGNAIRFAVQGEVDGIRYKLVSADGLRFCPYRIN